MSKKVMITFYEERKNNQQRNSTKNQTNEPLFILEWNTRFVLCGYPSIIIKEFKLIIFSILISSYFSLKFFSRLSSFAEQVEAVFVYRKDGNNLGRSTIVRSSASCEEQTQEV